MEDSIFTKIIKGEIPSYKVYEDEQHLAFLDINPRTVGHTLVVPKKQSDYLFDIDSKEYLALWEVSRKVARMLKEKLGCKRVCVGVYGYEIPHVHIHLFPSNAQGEVPVPPLNPEAKEKLEETARHLAL